jgi:hypothetical protein
MTSTETCQKGGSGQDPSGRTMAPWTFNVKFSCGTQLTFVSLIFATGEDRDLTILPPRSAPTHLALASLSTLGGSCSGLDPCQGVTSAPSRSFRVYWSWHPSSGTWLGHRAHLHRHRFLIQIHLMTTLRSRSAPAGNLRKVIALSTSWPPNGDRSHNSSSRYPTIGRSKTSDAQTPSGGLVRNLNSDINSVWVQVIMETIQRMAPDGSPLTVLAQQRLRRQTLSS